MPPSLNIGTLILSRASPWFQSLLYILLSTPRPSNWWSLCMDAMLRAVFSHLEQQILRGKSQSQFSFAGILPRVRLMTTSSPMTDYNVVYLPPLGKIESPGFLVHLPVSRNTGKSLEFPLKISNSTPPPRLRCHKSNRDSGEVEKLKLPRRGVGKYSVAATKHFQQQPLFSNVKTTQRDTRNVLNRL